MIPSVRLLLLVAALFPLAVLAGVWPAWSRWAMGAGAVLAGAAALDAWWSWRLLDGIEASADESRFHKDRPAPFVSSLQRGRGVALPDLRVGIAWPAGIEAEAEEQLTAIRPAGAVNLRWMLTPRRRGDFHLAVIHCASPSRLGLWEVRSRCKLGATIRVYPNLQSPDELLAIRGYATGEHAHRQIGRGREFEHLREYVPGDGYDEIDWKATARRGKPISRVFQVERTQDVYAVVDASRLTGRPAAAGAAEPRLERYIQAALALGMVAQKQGDRFGVIAFTDRVHDLVPSGRGGAQAALCRQSLYRLQPAPIPPDFEDVAAQMRIQLKGRALLVFLTDLDDPSAADGFATAAALLSRKHVVAALSIRPDGAAPLFTHPVESESDMYRQLGGHMRWKKLHETQARLRSLGVVFHLAEPDSVSRELARLYADIKRRQLL